MKKIFYFLVAVGTFMAGYQIIPEGSLVTGEYIGESQILDVSGGIVTLTRCLEFLRIGRTDGSFYDVVIASDRQYSYVSTGDSIFAFTDEDWDSTAASFNINVQRVYPSRGAQQTIQVLIPVAEWFPFAVDNEMYLLISIDSDEGHPDSSYFRQSRDLMVLTFPDLIEIAEITDRGKPIGLFRHEGTIAIMTERNIIETDSSAEGTLNSNMTETALFHISETGFDSLGWNYLGTKGYEMLRRTDDTYRNTYHGFAAGLSDIDIDGDGLLDIPTRNSVIGDGDMSYTEYSIRVNDMIVLSSDTAFADDFLFLSKFMPGGSGDLLIGRDYFCGDSLATTGCLEGWSDRYTEVKGFHDITGNGFAELFGWWSDTVLYCKIEPDTVKWTFKRGWNIISLPFAGLDSTIDSYTFAIPPAFAFDPIVRNYVATDTLRPGVGYFFLSDRDTVLYPVGDTISSIEVHSERGWNLVGCTSRWLSTRELETLEPIFLGPFYFDPVAKGYERREAIMPGTGFLFLSEDTDSFTIGVE